MIPVLSARPRVPWPRVPWIEWPAGALLLTTALAACGGGEPAGGAASEPGPDSWFEECGAELGLPAPPERWPDGVYFNPEIIKGGVGLLDYDGDGDLDVFQVRIPAPATPPGTIANRLFRQGGDGRFEDVSEAAGIVRPAFGQGLAVGDVDNDGDLDLYVTNYGPDLYFRNQGDGRFEEATAQAGFGGDEWSTAASFGDHDLDGFLDLFVVHYLRYDPGKRCTDPSDRQEYCGPRSFNGAPDQLWRNQGDGTFRDATREAGIELPQAGARATGLGIVWTDLSGDGVADIYVANDAEANQLWVHRPDGTFVDEGILRGVAVDRYGHTEASMGVATGDVNLDGVPDLFMTHLWEENNRLYLGTKGPLFRDGSMEARLSRFDLERTAFGCGFADLDLDGDLDLVVANGAVRRRPRLPGAPAGMWGDFAEPNQLFENDGSGRFSEENGKAGPLAAQVEVSRGLALGDLDGDGDLDVVTSNLDNSLRLYRNRAPRAGRHWLSVRALAHGRDALGAQVRVQVGERELLGFALAASSYCSSNDPRAHFGLGEASAVDEIVVAWPDGRRESFPGGAVDRCVTLVQGEGRPQ